MSDYYRSALGEDLRHLAARVVADVMRVTAKARSGRAVVQEYVALADSLEWTLGQEYLRQRGNKAFLSDSSPIPFVVNNDGTLSRNAAEVFFTSLVAAEKEGQLEDEICVLELGVGVGLFARYFLHHLRELCRQQKKDYYERLTYIAADRSERMLHDVLRHRVLAGHPGRYRVRVLDAMEPETLWRDMELEPQRHRDAETKDANHGWHGGHGSETIATAGDVGKSSAEESVESVSSVVNPRSRRLRAVFLNYLLDCLPAAVLEWDGDQVRQLCVQTCVARNVKLSGEGKRCQDPYRLDGCLIDEKGS